MSTGKGLNLYYTRLKRNPMRTTMYSDQYVKIVIRTTDELIGTYIPFLKKGGLIIPSDAAHQMGAIVALRVELFDYPHHFDVIGKIVWLTPEHVHLDKLNGTGVEFVSGDNEALWKILRQHYHKPSLVQRMRTDDDEGFRPRFK